MCDTWVAMSDATVTSNVIFGKNSDRPIFDCQPLVLHPRRVWAAGSKVKLEYVEVPQVEITYATLGSSPYWAWGYEVGINEYGVVAGNEAVFTKDLREAVEACKKGKDPRLGLLGMDLIRLALERSKTAGNAVEFMGSMIESYGQFGSHLPTKNHTRGSYDNSCIVADAHEAWVVETAGKRWVAKRVTEGHASISNELSIRSEWDLGSLDIKDYAITKGWWPERRKDDFDFAQAYTDEQWARHHSHPRAMRSLELLAQKYGEITLQWMMRIARDHYEGTFLKGPYFDAANPDLVSICMHVSPAGFTGGNTVSSSIVVLSKSLSELPLFWWSPYSPCNGCYIPFFVHGSKLPDVVSNAGTYSKKVVSAPRAEKDEFSPDSYWWLFRRLMDKVKGDPIKSLPGYYESRNRLIRERFDAIEREIEAEVPEVIRKAVELRNTHREEMTQILDKFTENCLNKVIVVLKDLLRQLG